MLSCFKGIFLSSSHIKSNKQTHSHEGWILETLTPGCINVTRVRIWIHITYYLTFKESVNIQNKVLSDISLQNQNDPRLDALEQDGRRFVALSPG